MLSPANYSSIGMLLSFALFVMGSTGCASSPKKKTIQPTRMNLDFPPIYPHEYFAADSETMLSYVQYRYSVPKEIESSMEDSLDEESFSIDQYAMAEPLWNEPLWDETANEELIIESNLLNRQTPREIVYIHTYSSWHWPDPYYGTWWSYYDYPYATRWHYYHYPRYHYGIHLSYGYYWGSPWHPWRPWHPRRYYYDPPKPKDDDARDVYNIAGERSSQPANANRRSSPSYTGAMPMSNYSSILDSNGVSSPRSIAPNYRAVPRPVSPSSPIDVPTPRLSPQRSLNPTFSVQPNRNFIQPNYRNSRRIEQTSPQSNRSPERISPQRMPSTTIPRASSVSPRR